ncbi:MAG: lysophospholipid acyltransferase family protein [Deltaproteobacteria bacterium]|nr:lysophospholipid acyltransferase family protein [Deltaproteobacteria bacterium]
MRSLLKSLSFILGNLPRALQKFLGALLGALAFRIDKKRRNIALDNLNRAFKGKLTPAEIERAGKKLFSNLAVMFFEFLSIPWLNRKKVDGFVECVGLENLKKAASRGKGVILCTAHFGNWELQAVYFGIKGYTIDLVVREADNPVFEEFIYWVRTKSSGNNMIYKRRAMRKLLTRLSEKGLVMILMDQNVTRSEGVFVDFFGTPACTNKGPALLAVASGAPVVPVFMIRTDKGHRIEIQEEIRLVNTGDKERDSEENTRRCTKVIEDTIRKYPEQWFWVHRRWKTRPESEEK